MRDAEPAIEFAPIVLTLQQRQRVTVRTIRPDDAERLKSAVRALSDESRYFRFMGGLPELPPQLLEIATHPRAGRELQLVATVGEGADETIVKCSATSPSECV